jgi:hypothetical protein
MKRTNEWMWAYSTHRDNKLHTELQLEYQKYAAGRNETACQVFGCVPMMGRREDGDGSYRPAKSWPRKQLSGFKDYMGTSYRIYTRTLWLCIRSLSCKLPLSAILVPRQQLRRLTAWLAQSLDGRSLRSIQMGLSNETGVTRGCVLWVHLVRPTFSETDILT